MKIKIANINDINDILNIIYLSINTSWNKNSILNYINENKIYLLSLKNKVKEKIVSFILFNNIFDEAEIYLIATHPKYRRNYFAQEILNFFLLKCKEKNIKYVFAELRKSNLQALNFYIKNYFIEIYIRKNYYQNPIEDAIVMKKNI